jgi:nitrate reductase (NAD(P)H)
MAAVTRQPVEDHFHLSKEKYAITLPSQLPQQSLIKEQKLQKNKNDVITNIDPRDVKTPDNWIPRHPDLIRLTGKHPLNCEPPLPLLMKEGFITSTPIHYVRNHGAVPKLNWDTHRLIVNG